MAVQLTGFDDVNLSQLNRVLLELDTLKKQLTEARAQIQRLVHKAFPQQ